MTAETCQATPAKLSAETEQLVETGLRCYVPAYRPRGVILDHGRGARLWDRNGNEFIDLGTGIGVNSLGHQDPELVEALVSQARKLWHTSTAY